MLKDFSLSAKKYVSLFMMCCLLLPTAACQESAITSSDVEPLRIANQMSLVTTQDDSSSNLSASIAAAISTEPDTDYASDKTEIYLFDETMEPLDLVNEILCSLGQTKYSSFVNAGPYLALVDTTRCRKNGDQSSSQTDQSSGQSQEFEKWVVDVTRADNSSPQIVSVWLEMTDGDGEIETIAARFEITEGSTSTNPFGQFTGHFQGSSDGETTMQGTLISNTTDDDLVNIQMSMGEESGQFSQKINAIVNPDGTSGHAYTKQEYSFGNFGPGGSLADPELLQAALADNDIFQNTNTVSKVASVAFNANHYLANNNLNGIESTRCADRQELRSAGYEYNLYEADGSRLTRQSGMSLKIEDSNEYAWAGYYGVWIPSSVESDDLSTLSLTDKDDNNYGIFQGEGMLIKRTKTLIEFGQLRDVPMNWWDSSESKSYVVEWNGTVLQKIGVEVCGESGCSIESITPEAFELTPNAWIGFWVSGVGSVNLVVPDNGIITDATTVPYYIEENVELDDFATSATLKCYYDCPKGNLSLDDLASNQPFLTNIFDDGEPYLYTFDPTDYSLADAEGGHVTIANGAEISLSSFYSWGIYSGPMVLADVEIENPWEIWSQDVTYHWQTGPSSWNKYTTIINSATDTAVSFDRPLRCTYNHPDLGLQILDYNGVGQLHGIPYTKIENSESGFARWIPAYTIPNGSELECEGDVYYSKVLFVEQTMADVDVAECTGLTIDESVTEPEITFVEPDIGDKPTLSDIPQVIGGVIQE